MNFEVRENEDGTYDVVEIITIYHGFNILEHAEKYALAKKHNYYAECAKERLISIANDRGDSLIVNEEHFAHSNMAKLPEILWKSITEGKIKE